MNLFNEKKLLIIASISSVITHIIGNLILFEISLLLTAFLIFRNSDKIKVNQLIVGYLFITLLSIMINNRMEWNVWGRYLGFVFLLVVYSPLFCSQKILRCRITVLKTMLFSFTIITVTSFAFMLLGIYPKINPNETAGGFAGVYSSSMTMAPIAALAALFLIAEMQQKRSRIYHIIFLLLSIICVFIQLISGSRSALVAFGISCLIFSYLRNKKNFIHFFRRIIIPLICILSLSQYIFKVDVTNLSIMRVVIEKQERDAGVSSRDSKWNNRISEFKSSPILGVGPFSIDENISHSDVSTSGGVEMGSSWLALLSTTGIIGFLFITLLFYRQFKGLWKKNTNKLLVALLSFFYLHMMYEGYMMSSRNILTVFFWCLLSVSFYNKGDKLSCAERA